MNDSDPISGPSGPDMDAIRAEGMRRHEEDMRRAERLVAQARAGTAGAPASPNDAKRRQLARGEYLVDFDWRGETATYAEDGRAVTLSCAYWGGPTGSVSHMFGVWELADGSRAKLSREERSLILKRVIENAAQHHQITLEASGE